MWFLRTAFPSLLLAAFELAAAPAPRLVSTSPQLTEALFQLGLGDRIVGTSAASEYPPQAAKIPVIGMLFAPSLEKTLSLNPTLVVLDTHNLNLPYAQALKGLGIATFLWNTQSPQKLVEDAERFLGQNGLSLPRFLQQWRKCLGKLSKRPQGSETFLGFVWQDPPVLMGHASFLSAVLELSGYRNALPRNLTSTYVPVSQEWLLAQKVEKVFYLRHSSESDTAVRKLFTQWWPVSSPPATALDADVYARASFTPLQSLLVTCAAP